MLEHAGRKLLLAGLLATVVSAPATAMDLLTTQQTAIGQVVVDAAALQTAPMVVQQSFATENNARSGNAVRPRARSGRQAAAYRPCAHLGCRGVHVLGVGY